MTFWCELCALSIFLFFVFMATFGMKETHHEAKREKCDLFTSLRVARGTAAHQIYIYVYIHVFYKNLAYFLQGVSIVTMVFFVYVSALLLFC